MRTRSLLATALLAWVFLAGSGPAATAESPGGGLRVVLEHSQLRAKVGEHFDYRPRIVNPGARAIDGLVAHLNVASLTTDVYVDPEDWSSSRSIVISHLGPGASTSLSWDLQAVSPGSFDVYVVLLPTRAAAVEPLVASPPMHLVVTKRTTLSAGGSLPVIVAVPALLAAGIALNRRRIRRQSREIRS